MSKLTDPELEGHRDEVKSNLIDQCLSSISIMRLGHNGATLRPRERCLS